MLIYVYKNLMNEMTKEEGDYAGSIFSAGRV